MSDEIQRVKIEDIPLTKNGCLKVELVPMPSGDSPWLTQGYYKILQKRDTTGFRMAIASSIASIIGVLATALVAIVTIRNAICLVIISAMMTGCTATVRSVYQTASISTTKSAVPNPIRLTVKSTSSPRFTRGRGITTYIAPLFKGSAADFVRPIVEASLAAGGGSVSEEAESELAIEVRELQSHIISNGLSISIQSRVALEVTLLVGDRAIASQLFEETKDRPAGGLIMPQTETNLLSEVVSRAVDRIIATDFQSGRIEADIPTESRGTGFAVSNLGHLITSLHIVENAKSITVVLADTRSLEAKVLYTDTLHDLAVLKIDADTHIFLTLASTSGLQIGDSVFTIGYPLPDLLGQDPVYTDGTISSMSGLRGEPSLVQISVPIQPGNSGGPLVNQEGSVIGIVTSTAAVGAFLRYSGTLPQNINWAVKADYARTLALEFLTKQSESTLDKVKKVSGAICEVHVSR